MELVSGEAIWSLWWAWVSFAVVLAILEIFAPGFILLGFAAGAAMIGLLLGVGGPGAAVLTGSFPITLLLFSLFSLIAWVLLRRVAGVRKGQIKYFDKDINED